MRCNHQVERVRERYENLLAEVREVAARVRARLEELRRQFPDDESLMDQLDPPAAASPCGPGEESPQSDMPNAGRGARRTPPLRQRNPGARRSPHAAAQTASDGPELT
jgi:hypothetical protein